MLGPDLLPIKRQGEYIDEISVRVVARWSMQHAYRFRIVARIQPGVADRYRAEGVRVCVEPLSTAVVCF
jgi:hypothetical protein